MYENKYALKRFFKSVTDGESGEDMDDGNESVHFDWDNTTVREACGLLKLLEDEEFLFFLEFFHRLMPDIDLLYSKLQTRSISVDEVTNQLGEFNTSIRGKERMWTISTLAMLTVLMKEQSHNIKGESLMLAK